MFTGRHHPSSRLTLVGVYVHHEERIGVDTGRLASCADTGVRATNGLDALIRSPAGRVAFMGAQLDTETVEPMLRRGVNVVTSYKATPGYMTRAQLPVFGARHMVVTGGLSR